MKAKQPRPSPLVTAWSYSRLDVYETCPRKFKHKFIDKLPEPPAPAMARGDRIHKGLEAYVLGRARSLPADLDKSVHTRLRDLVRGLKKLGGEIGTELEVAVDDQWTPTAWFAPETWLRAKFDLSIYVAASEPKYVHVIDWKSGNVYADKHQEQLDLYAPLAFARYGAAREVIAQMAYVDRGELGPEGVYKRSGWATMKKRWGRRVAPLFSDRKFLPAPSASNCKWCPFSFRKGGPCKEAA